MNNIATFRKLFEAHFTPLVKYSFGITQDKEQARDIVQNFFVQFWHQYTLDQIDSFEAFAFVSVKNKSLSWVQSQKKFVGELPEIPSSAIPVASEDEAFPGFLLESAIRTLPEKCKDIFMLSKLEGLTYPEIAETRDLSIKTVERQISIGLAKLREILAPHKELIMDLINERS